jgi:GH15 family glucan-1,4-alpha-glucosidase
VVGRLRGDWGRVERWRKAADEIHADICEHGVDERRVFVQRYDTTALDAALGLMPLLRFLPPQDERVRNTVMAIGSELTEHGLVLRYRPEETDDGLAGTEGTFLICSFWLVSAYSEIGEDRPCPQPLRAGARAREPARSVRRGDLSSHRPPPRQLPPSVHPSRADQRRDARDPRRSGARAGALALERRR